jgi:hypothetical protein
LEAIFTPLSATNANLAPRASALLIASRIGPAAPAAAVLPEKV